MFGMLGSLVGPNYHDGTLGGQQYYGHQTAMKLNHQSALGMQNGYNSQLAQGMLAHQYHQQATQPKMPEWVFNGKTCSVREMADEIWHIDCPEKTHFLLKYE